MRKKSRVLVTLKALTQYKSFLFGLLILMIFLGLTVYAAVTWPYEFAIKAWNNPAEWQNYPREAPPAWVALLLGRKEIDGFLVLQSTNPDVTVRKLEPSTNMEEVDVNIRFDYDAFPQNIQICFVPVRGSIPSNETPKDIGVRYLRWMKPNGVNVTLDIGRIPLADKHCVRLSPVIGGESPVITSYIKSMQKLYPDVDVAGIVKGLNLSYIHVMFADDSALMENQVIRPLSGIYKVKYRYQVKGIESLELSIVIVGNVYGLLGTDRIGRDLFMGIAWGTPYALAFGLLASVISTILAMLLAAVSAWYKSYIDVFTSRLNEIFIILPFLPTIIMIMILYGFTIWTLLGVVIAFSVLGSTGIKSQRALFLQIRELPYIEAAKAYGASNARIIFRYMIPKVLPVIIPNIVTAVPSFVFLEASLAILGVSDPSAITWGKILDEAYRSAALIGRAYHWIFAPSFALFLLSASFALIGFTLDRVLNPRLRQA